MTSIRSPGRLAPKAIPAAVPAASPMTKHGPVTRAGMALDASLPGGQIDVTELQRRLDNQGAYLGRTTPEPLL